MSDDPSSNPDITTSEPEASITDNLAKNRALPVLAPEAIPDPTPGFVPTPAENRVASLRKMAKSSVAEGKNALRQCAGRGPKMKEELGPHAPESPKAQALLERLETIEDGKARAALLMQYYEEMEDITQSDIVEYLEATNEEYQHFAKKNSILKTLYSALVGFFEEHKKAIRKGLARARRQKKEAQKDKEKPAA